jgi:hypothetical protein
MTIEINLEGTRTAAGSITLPPPIEDTYLKTLVDYIKSALNYVFDPVVIVKSAADYNVFDVPLQGYPLLKGYRTTDTVLPNTSISITTVALQHCMVYARQSNAGAFSSLIGDIIKLAIIEPNFYADTGIKVDTNTPLTVSYNTTFSENYEPVMNIVTATFNIYTSI